MKKLMFLTAALAAAAAGAAEIVEFRVLPDRADCHYALGERSKLTVTAVGTNGVALTSGRLRYVVDNFGSVTNVGVTAVDLAKENPFTVTVTRSTPGFERLRVQSDDAGLTVRSNAGNHECEFVYGVAFAPEKIVSGTPEPADFDEFWAEARRKLDRTVPIDAKMELVPAKSTAEVNYYNVSFATCGGRRIYGWLTEPKNLSNGPYPVRLSVPGAGIGASGTSVVPGEISMVLNVHDYVQAEGPYGTPEQKRLLDDENRRWGEKYGVKGYWHSGIHLGREEYFYYAAILGITRAIDWLAARPACDRRDFTYSGTSQGGGFGLILSALNTNITSAAIYVPALTDLLGFRVEGRQSGWPRLVEAQRPENRAAAEKWAPYFCGVNFARRVKIPVRFVAGFGDTVCTPAGVYAAYNVCPSKDKAIYDGLGMGHGVFDDFYTYLFAWQKGLAAKKSDYRFLAFNIWGDFFGNPPHERDLRQAALVKRWNPDVVGLQEVTPWGFWKSRLFDALKDEYEVVGKGLGPGGIDASDPVLYRRSRFRLVARGAEWFCEELDTSKGMVWAVVEDKATKKRLALFASHYWWRYDGEGDNWIRLDNSKRLRAKMTELAGRYHAAIIGGGDLNAPLESSAMKYLIASGLADAQDGATFSPKGVPTHHGNPVRDLNGVYRGIPAFRGSVYRVQFLDHIFYDPVAIEMNRFDMDFSLEACSLSDHHPIIGDFNIR